MVPPPAQFPSQSLARVWSASGDLGEAGRRHYVGRKDRGLAPRVGVVADGGAREKTAKLQCYFAGRKQLPTMLELRRSRGPTAGRPVLLPSVPGAAATRPDSRLLQPHGLVWRPFPETRLDVREGRAGRARGGGRLDQSHRLAGPWRTGLGVEPGREGCVGCIWGRN